MKKTQLIMKKTIITCIALCAIFLACNNEEDATATPTDLFSTVEFEKIRLRTAQHFDDKLNSKLENDPEFARKYAENEEFVKVYSKVQEEKEKSGKRNLPIYTIKVVVNNIYRSQPLSMELIEGQIERLNQAFRGRLSGPSGLPSNARRFNAGDTRIRFELDKVKFRRNQRRFKNNTDLYARSTGGINPTLPGRRINIYVADLIVASGFEIGFVGDAGFPDEGDPEFDHVFIDALAFGVRPGSGKLNEGKTLAHEIGHYFNLLHLPGKTTETCRFDDAVGDTPNSTRLYFGDVSTGRSTTSCGSQDMYWNFMNNTDDSERFMFTNGQRNRMRATLDPKRGSRRRLTNAR